jgi:hypothetical protein
VGRGQDIGETPFDLDANAFHFLADAGHSR